MLINRHVTMPMLAISLRLRICDTTGSRGRVGPGDANQGQRRIVQQPEVGAALADRQMLREMTIGAQRAHAEFDGRLRSVQFPRLQQRYEHVGADIVRGLAAGFFLDRAPARQAPDRKEQVFDRAADLVHRRRIQRPDRHLVLFCRGNARKRREPGAAHIRGSGCGRAPRGIRGYWI